jgi:hypothetical protein
MQMQALAAFGAPPSLQNLLLNTTPLSLFLLILLLRLRPGSLSPRTSRERVLFIGTQFSILYTSMYSPAEAATRVLCFEVGDGFDVLVQAHVARSVTPRPSPPGRPPPLQSPGDAVVLEGLRIVLLRLIRVPEVPVGPTLHRPAAHLLCNRQVLREVLIALE